MKSYRDYVQEYPDLSVDELADIVIEDGRDAERRSIKQCIRRSRRRIEDIKIEQDERNGDRYTINHDASTYTFYISQEKNDSIVLDLPFNVVQSIFEWYAEPHSLTIDQTVRRLHQVYGDTCASVERMTDRIFRRIKETLSLTHRKKPIAPHLYESHTEEQLQEKYLEVVESKFEAKLKASEADRWRKKWEKEREKTVTIQTVLDRLEETMATPDFPSVQAVEPDASLDPTSLLIHIGDWHVGRVVDVDHHTYNKEVFRDRVQTLKQRIANEIKASRRPVREIHICDVGDHVESVKANLHPEQGQGVDLFGMDQIKWAAHAKADLMEHVASLLPDTDVTLHAVGGNHDRITKDYRDDPGRLPAETVIEFTKEYVSDDMRVTYCPRVVDSFLVHDTQVFLTHGDQSPSDFKDLIFAKRDPAASHYLVLEGHIHHLSVTEAMDMMQMSCGSLLGPTEYSVDQLGELHRPSQTMCEVRPGDGPHPMTWLPVD